MKIIIKILLSLFCCILMYCIIWYSWGSYARSYIEKTIDKGFFVPNTKFVYKNITLSGFPFNLNFTIKNLQSTTDHNTIVEFPEIEISTNVIIKKVNIAFGNNFTILQKDTPPLLLRFKNGALISVKLYSSTLSLLAASSKFNFTDIATMNYTDYGYSIIDTQKNEKLFMSNNNAIKATSFINSTNDFNLRIKSALNGRGSIYLENQKIRGESFLNTDIIVSSSYNNEATINSMSLNFIKCTLSSDHYILNLLGHMNFKRHFGFNGQVNASITDLPEFFDSLRVLVKEKTLNKWANILKAMNQEEILDHQHNNNNISFRITGNHNNIMWGRLTDHTLTKMLLY